MKWEDNVRKVDPYTPGEQPKDKKIIKLNTNECPYPPAPGVLKAMEQMDYTKFRLYPEVDSTAIVDALSDVYGLHRNQIFLGVGSDDVLALIFLTFFNSKKPVLFPDITYSFYDVWAELYKVPYIQIPLDEHFQIHTRDYIRENGGIVLANPNAPTGIALGRDALEEVIAKNPDSVVVIDEAYVDFGAETCIPLIEKYDNLLVVQTFSKSRSMAGMRIGYAMGQPKLIQYMSDCKNSINSYTINRPTQEMGAESVRDIAYFKETTSKMIATRERIKKELEELNFFCTDSKTNFLFVSHKEVPAQELFEALRTEGIYVRYWNKGRINNYLRISIGTDQEMDTLVSFLKKYLSGKR